MEPTFKCSGITPHRQLKLFSRGFQNAIGKLVFVLVDHRNFRNDSGLSEKSLLSSLRLIEQFGKPWARKIAIENGPHTTLFAQLSEFRSDEFFFPTAF